MEARAFEAEERISRSRNKKEALENAILAAETYMSAINLTSSAFDRDRLKSRCMHVLTRAEEIKKTEDWSSIELPSQNTGAGAQLRTPISDRALSTREKVILLEGSRLHGFIFPPWTSEPADELFLPTDEGDIYTDQSDLNLSESQLEIFAGWKRPHEIFRNYRVDADLQAVAVSPTMTARDKIDLVQDVTADCSVVASLCAAVSQAEQGFKMLLCTIFFPSDKVNLRPVMSKTGRYIFRLHFNGCFRRVVVDDRLPDSNSSRTLHVVDRRNPGLLWPALLEKAYLKVRGGYDFPGSNSGTDLWVLTGWIPEQIFLQSEELNPQELWQRVSRSHNFGDVMVTLGTGRLTQREEEGLGLAGEHDYAVLDMKEVGGQLLLLVKNPWCDGTIWKGYLSQQPGHDNQAEGWAYGTGAELNTTSGMSPGTFWIAFNEVVRNFESMYLNWNPGLFRYRQDHHLSWSPEVVTSPACFNHNPQYSIESTSGGPVWVLLSRHFSTEESRMLSGATHANAGRIPLGFISLYIFDRNGKKVYVSDDAMIRGPFVDSPQTLVRLDMPPLTCYTVVVAQQDLPLPKYSFTVSAYSRDRLVIGRAANPYSHNISISGAWTSRTAGGNANSSSYSSNPQFRLIVPSTTDIALLLEATQFEMPVHVQMVWAGGDRVTSITSRDILGQSGEYRRGLAFAEILNIPPGIYTIVCSTFEPGQIGNFNLLLEFMNLCEVTTIADEAAGRHSLQLPILLLRDGFNRMLAPVIVSRLTSIKIIVRHCEASTQTKARSPIRVLLERGQGPNKELLASSSTGGEFSDAAAGVRIADFDIEPQMAGPEGIWLVVERLSGVQSLEKIEVEVLSEAPIEIGVWGTGDG